MHETLSLACGDSRVDIVPALGGKIASLRLGGREWLWTNVALPRLAPTPAVAADDHASYVETADTGGYDECVPTVGACTLGGVAPGYAGLTLPDHGELWSQYAPTERLKDDATGIAAITHWTGHRMPYGFTRTVRVTDDDTVFIDYALTNRGGVPLPFLWSAHPLLPLTPDTRLDLPEGARVRVWSQHGVDLGGDGAEYRWPRLGVGGREVDFSAPNDVPADGWSCKLFLDLADARLAGARGDEVVLAVEQGGARLEVMLETREVPHFGLWINHGGWTPFPGVRYMNVGFEPCIGMGDTLDAALGAWASAAWLPAGRSRRWTLEWRARPA